MMNREVKGAVEELMHAYVHCIDDDKLEEWPEFFTEECIYKIISRDNYSRGYELAVIFCDSKGMLQDRVTSHRKVNIFSPHYYRHLLSSIHIIGQEEGDTYIVQSNYAVLQTKLDGDTTIYNAGKYLDKIVFLEGIPKFKEKLVIYDTSRVPTLLATPI